MNTAEISTDSTRKYIKCQLWYTACKTQINKVQSTYPPYLGRFEINEMASIKKNTFIKLKFL